MAERLIDSGLYLLARAWVVCAALIAIAAIKIVSDIAAPVSHPELVVVRIN
jgi:hypothetical protein